MSNKDRLNKAQQPRKLDPNNFERREDYLAAVKKQNPGQRYVVVGDRTYDLEEEEGFMDKVTDFLNPQLGKSRKELLKQQWDEAKETNRKFLENHERRGLLKPSDIRKYKVDNTSNS